MLTIDIDTARRFILGKQGLWPGRRWRGAEGTAQAMRDMEYLQLDPLQIIARSQDIALHSRVLDYTPGMWEEVTYQQRHFFDWGGWLAVRPMDELPHWRVVMQPRAGRQSDCDRRVRTNGPRPCRRHRRNADHSARARHCEQPRLQDGGRGRARRATAAARTAPWPCTICGAPAR